ncbi:dTDP-4-dehydrorhamnose reductase [Cytobacillus solani]|uniref:dTDP-4-dehydrorhamnose reductase n=1 Tax=Cytobacillus solani TaxID=1637975 RepID=A0A0Q3T712_9BACI|nr:dTDP-4-dehydrorhamnose reductase [Cytobacillus solani]KOP82291.1 dTDP-4-dehydrorhamnose reductase [Bacillus sp. FJAT-21945]KQL19301.1 dTDP-4-dehydrorhamnose reductase [Cytobacillus solani]USK57211.1 dTDP-4-dehydrorhamnose reductase [Cytobacillus solani]
MNILITGAHGQLGKELEKQLCTSHSVIGLGKKDLDITNKIQVDHLISHYKPQLIIHAAAFTAVDQCEIEPKKAMEVNALGTQYIAHAANKIQARLFYISSDYVFDGKKNKPYTEEDEPNPQSIYGLSKWLGEQLTRHCYHSTIIRTSWLYGHGGNNFVKTMLNLSKKGKEIKVVNDQLGSPTYVNDLTEMIIQLMDKKNGIYHISNSGSCTWNEFARAIFEEAGVNPDLVLPITTGEYKALAPRPQFSVFSHQALLREEIARPRLWKEALKEFIRKETSQ